MTSQVDSGFKAVVDKLVQQRQDFLASLKSGSSMLKLTYQGKTLLCVYMRHTDTTVTVMTTKEIVAHLWGNATLCLSGTFEEADVKFPLNEVQLANG